VSRKSKPVVCAKSDIQQLQSIAGGHSYKRLAERAAMVLGCIEGRQVKDIAAEMGERPNTVIFWRDRFAEKGVSSLCNLPRGHQRVKYGEPFKERMLRKLEESPPDGHARWTGKLLSTALGESSDTVWRYLRKAGIRLRGSPHQIENKPFEYTMGLSFDLTLKKDNIMAKEKTHEKSDIELVARIKKADGTVIEKTITMEKSIPDIDDFDFGTRAGFMADLDMYENSMRSARDQLMDEITQSYMSSSKKKKTGGTEGQKK